MKKTNILLSYLVTGLPDEGKTSFSIALAKISGDYFVSGCQPIFNPKSIVIMLDRSFYLFIGENPATTKYSITTAIHKDAKLDKDEFLKVVIKEIDEMLEYNPNQIIIEGYVLNFIKEEVENYLKDKTLSAHIRMRNYVIHYLDEVYSTKRCESPNSYTDEIVVAYRDAIQLLKQKLVEVHGKNILSQVNYQAFPDLGINVKNSDSIKKFKSLNLKNLQDKKVLDVGCNHGRFCIESIRLGASVVHGIDSNKNFLHTASALNNIFYRYNISFFECDFLNFNQSNYDIIIACSVFHYFKENQPEFFKKAYDLLVKDGVLILEAGISDLHPDKEFIEKYQRGVDPTPCHFPNHLALLAMAQGFKCEYLGSSVNQHGDRINRKVYHLRKL
jgi:2-polyprenyl-3-methyl-5-hydroxy-6-metoxy-1,4-benzoquinol methylase